MDTPVNSRAWWEAYFSNQWDANNGSQQTVHFMQRLLASLPDQVDSYLRARPLKILDWGCAFGEGVHLLGSRYPQSTISGLDFSSVAVEEARRRYPHHEFILTEAGTIPRAFDVIITSNCLEHFSDPLRIVNEQLEQCRKLFIALVPYNEYPISEFHLSQFREESFPERLKGFKRLHCSPIDVDRSFWNGQQLLVVYGSVLYLNERAQMTTQNSEQEKWEQYYAELSLPELDAASQQFNREFAEQISALLPAGSVTLEAGCGGGWQSLALAQSGMFNVRLMDFSRNALDYARRVFEQANCSAEFLLGDVFDTGECDYDLVFNAGSLEHYTFDRQVQFLKGMASRSRRYVLALVPNGQCYWYWLWRIQQASVGNWPYGKEVPLSDLSRLFEQAGLRFLGQAFMGADWTEAFITNLAGLSESLRHTLLEIHRSRLQIPLAQRSYLIAAIGCVPDAPDTPDQMPPIWHAFNPEHVESESLPTLNAALADALAMRIGSENQIVVRDQAERTLRVQLDEIRIASQKAVEALNSQLADRDRSIGGLSQQLAERDGRIGNLEARLTAGERQFSETQAAHEHQLQTLEVAHENRLQTLEAIHADQLRAAQEAHASQVLDFENRIVDLSNQAQATEGRLVQQAKAADTLRAQLAARESMLSDLETRLATYERQLNEAQAANAAQMQQIAAATQALRQSGERFRSALENTWTALETYHASESARIGRFAERLWRRLVREGPRGWWRMIRWATAHARGRKPSDMGEFDHLVSIRSRIRITLDSERLPAVPLIDSTSSDRTVKPVTVISKSKSEDHASALTASPLISVLLPVYNHADMLGQAIRSVLDQDYPRFELIVLDDGSTDSFEEAVRPFLSERRLRVYRQANQRLPRALTHLQELAVGELITWTSADNLLEPGMLRALATYLLEHPEAVLVYGDTALIDDSGASLMGGDYRPQNRDLLSPELLRLYRSPHPLGYEADNYINACFMYRASVGRALRRYADDLNGLEDYDFWLRMQKAGAIQHIGNDRPLYRYRVHARTMSAELLSIRRAEHIARSEMLMALEARRRAYCDQPFSVEIDPGLAATDQAALRDLATRTALTVRDEQTSASQKRLRFVPSDARVEPSRDVTAVRVHADTWELVATDPLSGQPGAIYHPRGIQMNPLAYKARQYNPLPGEIFADVTATVLGCHIPLANYPLDLTRCRAIFASNQDVLFVILDSPEGPDPTLGAALRDGNTNVAYIGPAEWSAWNRIYHPGEMYQVYATFSGFWMPPIRSDAALSAHMHESCVALAYTTGRPIFAFHRAAGVESSPGVYPVSDKVPLRGTLAIAESASLDHALADRYLAAWSPQSRFENLLRLANTATQDSVQRPAFGGEIRPVDSPRPWPTVPSLVDSADSAGAMRVLLHVESLDKGGLEQVVRALTQGLRAEGVTIAVACAQRGGYIADRMREQGIPIHVLNGSASAYEHLLDTFRPDVVNTHYGSSHLSLIRRRGIPILETLHNMYVFYDGAQWVAEREKRAYVNHYIAVSETVKAYFLRHMPGLAASAVSVIPNPAVAERISPIPRDEARRRIGIEPDAFLFLNLATYDGRKNQIGLLAAFEDVAANYPNARLLCAGNVADPAYYGRIVHFRESLRAAPSIRLSDFTEDVASLYSAADCFVLSSIFEGWSIAASEAQLYGLPIIHTDCGSARELCGADQARGILVPNPGGDPMALDAMRLGALVSADRHANQAALAGAMRDMVENRAYWATRRDQIVAYAKTQFAIERSARAYISAYRALCAQPTTVK